MNLPRKHLDATLLTGTWLWEDCMGSRGGTWREPAEVVQINNITTFSNIHRITLQFTVYNRLANANKDDIDQTNATVHPSPRFRVTHDDYEWIP